MHLTSLRRPTALLAIALTTASCGSAAANDRSAASTSLIRTSTHTSRTSTSTSTSTSGASSTSTTSTLPPRESDEPDDTDPAPSRPTQPAPASTAPTPPACHGADGLTGHFTSEAGTELGDYTLDEHSPGVGQIAGAVTEGVIDLSSDGSSLSGTFELSWHGSGDIGFGGGVSSSIEDDSTLTGSVSGTVGDAVLDGRIVGTETVDGSPTPGSRPIHLPLDIHVGPDCTTLQGDAIALLAAEVDGQAVTVGGFGVWVAVREP